MTTSVAMMAVTDPEPEDRLHPAETRGEEQQHAGENGPDLTGHAVDEAEHLGASVRRDDVVERAPGGVRDAALGDLLAEPERSGGGERELQEPCREPEHVHDRLNARAPAETPSRAYSRFATTSDTTNDVAVTAVDSKPRAVASWTLSGNSRDAAIMNGNDTEKSSTASST